MRQLQHTTPFCYKWRALLPLQYEEMRIAPQWLGATQPEVFKQFWDKHTLKRKFQVHV